MSIEVPSTPLSTIPSTRYVGSKRRLLPHLFQVFKRLEFESALDLFSGTASVAYLWKQMGKKVRTNDYLWSNYWTAVAIIENSCVTLSDLDVDLVLKHSTRHETPNFIAATFKDFYFTDEENRWLDASVDNILKLKEHYPSKIARFKQAIALHSMFQSALRKRPFNMFHRRNLYIRLAEVERQFGNAITWEKTFNDHFKELVEETNALVFSNGKTHKVYRNDAITWKGVPRSDLVYIDPPYVWSGASPAEVDYLPKYHFLEGLARYKSWPSLIDKTSPLLQLRDGYRQWPGSNAKDRLKLPKFFSILLKRFRKQIVVVSYRQPGFPTIGEICKLLKEYKRHVYVAKWPYSYALRKPTEDANSSTKEVVIIGIDGSYSGPGREIK